MRILLVEDDPTLARRLKESLGAAGFAVDVVDNGEDGEALGRERHYQAAVLDLGLPRRAGLEVLRNWRRQRVGLPVLILTARNSWQERVAGFEAGSDDYLGKPFHVEELVVRLRALIQRSSTGIAAPLEAEGYTLDESRQCVRDPQGNLITLTATEFRLLRVLMLNPGRILPQETLLEAIYDYDATPEHNTIEVYINRLRKKLGRHTIQTHRRQGYQFHRRTPPP